MDEALEAAKESAWREIRRIDAAYERGEIGDAEWHEAMASLVVPAYLVAENPRAGSGHSGTSEDWEWSRGIVAEGIPATAQTYLDVGCANGLLMESVHRWSGVEPYGLEISPELAELARRRLPHWRDRIFVGSALIWEPGRRFDVVRTGLEYVPKPRRPELVAHLLSFCDRLVIGKFNEEAGERRLEGEVASWGRVIAGHAERAHRTEPRLVYRAFWIDAPG